jgi:hypothetical protein
MMRKLLVIFSVTLLAAVTALGGGRNLKNIRPAVPMIDDGIERTAPADHKGTYVPGLDNPTSLTWVIVDSMQNALGPANTSITPLVYDAPTNVVALLHRASTTYGTSSGQLWYNTSTNSGATWRRVGELNGGAPTDCRYPSGAISNPAGSSDTGQCLFVYAAPNLQNAGTFGQITYGVDFPLGGGAGSGVVDAGTNTYTSSTAIWTQPSGSWIWWGTNSTATTGNDETNWRTNDYVTVTRQIPPGWLDAEPNFVNALGHLNGFATPTASYYCVSGLFFPDTLAAAFNAGYSKSTDNGATWGAWQRPAPDWMQATGLPPRYDLYDYVQPAGGTVSYDQDALIDGNGRVHFFHVIVDSPWTGTDPRGILEAYETGPNTWAAKFVTMGLNPYTGLGYPGASTPASPYLSQTGNGMHVSISADGQVMAAVWLDAATSSPTDTLPDIWFSYRNINGSAWSTPVNLTQTPGFPELILHAAPVMKVNGGGSYTIFLGRTYQSSINTYPPDYNLRSTFYVAAHTFTPTGVSEEASKPSTFTLEQNYPNPFNPSTTIQYSVANAGPVTLKVYNMIGQEVATLVNQTVTAGSHSATFDASGLSSGMYFYKLSAGSQVESRKMLVLK